MTMACEVQFSAQWPVTSLAGCGSDKVSGTVMSLTLPGPVPVAGAGRPEAGYVLVGGCCSPRVENGTAERNSLDRSFTPKGSPRAENLMAIFQSSFSAGIIHGIQTAKSEKYATRANASP